VQRRDAVEDQIGYRRRRRGSWRAGRWPPLALIC
jgi:hypothetical protein